MKNQDAPPTISSALEKPNKNTIKEEIPKNEIKEENITNEPGNRNPQINQTATKQEDSTFKIYPQRLHGDLEFDIYDDNLTPDCIYMLDGRKNLVYFNLYSLINNIEEKIKNLFEENPKNFENIRKPLEDYMKTFHNEEYVDTYWISGTFLEKIKFLFGKENYDKNKQNRAIKFAYIYSQVNSYLKKFEKYSKEKGIDKQELIGMIDSFNYQFIPKKNDNILKIKNEISRFRSKLDNLDGIKETLQTLEELMEKVIKDITDKYKKEEDILILYLSKEIDQKLSEIESCCNIPEKTDAYIKMRKLRSKINRCLLKKIPIEKKGEKDNFFFGLDLRFKILKDTITEKKVLLDGININNFFNTINKNFEDLRDQLFKFDKDEMKNGVITTEDRMNFISKYMSKVEKLEELRKNIQIEINNKKKVILIRLLIWLKMVLMV